MIKLYHRPGARGDRVVWLLEELEVDYELEIVERCRSKFSISQDESPRSCSRHVA